MSIGDHGFHLSATGMPDAADWIRATDLRLKEWRIVTGVDVPYCAGYSQNVNRRIVYIDRDVPQFWTDRRGEKLDVWHGPLFWHESIECDLLNKYPDEHYQGAHTIATYVENTDVKLRGFDPQEYENEFWVPLIKKIGARKLYEHVPIDLDLRPYYDSGDQKLLQRMKFKRVAA
jgi:hypothetical protein